MKVDTVEYALGRTLAAVCGMVLGRRNFVRLSRFLLDCARLDGPNLMDRNGEGDVQARVARGADAGAGLVVFDVGGNEGLWTCGMLRACEAAGRNDVDVHVFEPLAANRGRIASNLQSHPLRTRVKVNGCGLSDKPCRASFYVPTSGTGTSSLHETSLTVDSYNVEEIDLSTVDAYCLANGIRRITFLKVDVEGHDLAVLAGAGSMLREGAIELLQFEYNHRWIAARRYLRDAFESLLPLGYRIGKITPRGIEFYAGWHHELETFREANYLACRKEWVARLPAIPWWNAGEAGAPRHASGAGLPTPGAPEKEAAAPARARRA